MQKNKENSSPNKGKTIKENITPQKCLYNQNLMVNQNS